MADIAYPSASFQDDCDAAIAGSVAFTIRVTGSKRICAVERYLARITQAANQPSFLVATLDNFKISRFIGGIADAFLHEWIFTSRKEGDALIVRVEPPRRVH